MLFVRMNFARDCGSSCKFHVGPNYLRSGNCANRGDEIMVWFDVRKGVVDVFFVVY